MPIRTILTFITRAIVLFAVLVWAWSYILPSYIELLTPVANKELHIIGVAGITRLGPSPDPLYELAVYHRDAAGMSDSLFDIKIESFRAQVPMLLALVLAMPVTIVRRVKAAVAGLLILYILDSLASILVLTWSYTFLPEHHEWSPFTHSAVRDAIVDYLYGFYNTVGVGFIPLVVWILVGVRKADLTMFTFRREGRRIKQARNQP